MPATKKKAADSGDKRAAFERVAGKRVANVLEKIAVLEKCANPSAYDFTHEDVDKMQATLEDAVTDCVLSYRDAVDGKKKTASAPSFSF
jgi:hypothetical protein